MYLQLFFVLAVVTVGHAYYPGNGCCSGTGCGAPCGGPICPQPCPLPPPPPPPPPPVCCTPFNYRQPCNPGCGNIVQGYGGFAGGLQGGAYGGFAQQYSGAQYSGAQYIGSYYPGAQGLTHGVGAGSPYGLYKK